MLRHMTWDARVPRQSAGLSAGCSTDAPVSAKAPGRAVGDGSSAWASATRVGDPDCVLGSWQSGQ